MEKAQLIVGLGNPGGEYAATRHNAGFLLLELLASRWRAGWSMNRKFNARLARAQCEGRKVILAQPQTFMNLSGDAVGAIMDYYHVPAAQVVVVVDDADLPLGELRLRPRGSSGGHHGLESIEQRLGTRDYPRLRLGIGRAVDGRRQITDYVLGRFDPEESERFQKVLQRAAGQIECWLALGIQMAMTKFNGAITTTKEDQ